MAMTWVESDAGRTVACQLAERRHARLPGRHQPAGPWCRTHRMWAHSPAHRHALHEQSDPTRAGGPCPSCTTPD